MMHHHSDSAARVIIRQARLPRRFGVLCIVVLTAAVFSLCMAAQPVRAGDNLWTWTGAGRTVTQIATDPLHPGTVYALSGESWDTANKILRSTDGGATWTNVAPLSWNKVTGIALAHTASNIVYATTTSGVFKSSNYGSDWHLINSNSAGAAVAVSPADAGTVYIATYKMVDGENTAVILRTFDGGSTWTDETYGLLNYPPIDQLVVAPSAPHILIAKPFNMANGPLFKSTDFGRTWSQIGGSQLVSTGWVTVDPKSSSVIYLGTFSPGAWKSTDGGASWLPIANGLQQNGRGFVVDPDNTQVVHAFGVASGVFESLDGGTSWTAMNSGIQGLEITSLAIASRQPLVLYAGVAYGGIWKYTRTNVQDFGVSINDGATFTNQQNVTLSLTAPSGTTQMQISNDDGFAGAAWEPFMNRKEWAMTSPGSAVLPHVVYTKFKTNGQITAMYQDDIVLDTTSPSGTIAVEPQPQLGGAAAAEPAFTIHDSGAYTLSVPFVVNSYRPGFRTVQLKLGASDDLSGVGSVLVSNSSDFVGSQWTDYAPAMTWYVNEHGATTVYAKYRDRAGNESPTYTAETTAQELESFHHSR